MAPNSDQPVKTMLEKQGRSRNHSADAETGNHPVVEIKADVEAREYSKLVEAGDVQARASCFQNLALVDVTIEEEKQESPPKCKFLLPTISGGSQGHRYVQPRCW